MAERRLVYGVHFDGTETFQQKAAIVNKVVSNINAEIRKLDATYGKGSKNSDYLAQRSELLTQKLEAQRKKTEALRQGLDQYRNSEKASAAEIERREKQLKSCEIAEADLTRQIKECATAMKNSKSSIEESLAGLEQFEKKAQSVGNSLTRALTVPIAGMGTLALKNSLEFEDAMKTVQTLPGVTTGTAEEQAAQLEAYSDAILDASNATHVAAEELAAAQYSAISSGVAAEDSVYTVERAAKAAKAGLSDVETVVDGATSALNAWKDTSGGLDHVLDAMMVAQNVGKTTIDQLASNIGQVTGLAPQLGVALDEVLASVAALTQGGVATSTAFNGLMAVMSNVLKPTAEAREEAERLGLEFSAAAMQAKGFTGFLESVMEATKGDAESLGKLFGSTEALSEIMALGTTQAGNYADALKQISGAAGAVDEAFAIRTSSKAEQLAGSLNKLRNAGIELSEALYPAVGTVADLAGKAADIVGDMDEGAQQTLVYVLGIVAAVGPAVKTVGSLAGGVSKLVSAGSKIKSLLTGAGGLAAGAKTLLSTLAGPVGLVALVGTGLVTAGYAASEACAKLGRDYTKLDETVKNLDLAVDAEKLDALTAGIDAAIADAQATKTVTIKAYYDPDVSDAAQVYDEVMKELDGVWDKAIADHKVQWAEYTAATGIINGAMLQEAQAALNDPGKSTVAAELIGLIDDANALLREMYTSGDSVTAEEVKQFEMLLDQIGAYRAEITGIASDTETQYNTLTTMVNHAAADYRISEAEYQAVRDRLNTEVKPDVEDAMEDAATNGIATELDKALAELDTLLATISSAGRDATQDEIDQMNSLLAEIAALQHQIAVLQGNAELLDSWGDELKKSDEFYATASGYATPAIAAKAAGNAIALRQQSHAALDTEESRLEAEYAAKVAEARKTNDTSAMDDAREAYEEQMAMVANERQRVEAEFFQNLQQLWVGYAESTGENEDFALSLDRMGKYIDNILRSENMTNEEWARIIADDNQIRNQGMDYDFVLYSLNKGDTNLFDKYQFNDAVVRWRQAQIDSLAQEMEKLNLDSTDLDEFYWSMLPEDFDVNAQDPSGLNETFANYQRLLLLLEHGSEAITEAQMGGLTEGVNWEDYDWEALNKQAEEKGGAAGEAYGAAMTAGLTGEAEKVEEAAEDLSDAAANGSEPDAGKAAAYGLQLAAAYGSGITAGTPLAVSAAAAMAAQVNSALAGMSPVLPGAGLDGGGGGTAAVTAAASSVSSTVDQSIHVGIQNANFTDERQVRTVAAKLNTYSRMKNAGVGNVTRV